MSSFLAVVRRIFHSGDHPCLVTREHGTLSYRVLWGNAVRLAAEWESQGLRRGDTVAFLLPNHPGLLVGYLACLIGGFVACPVLDSNHPDLVEEILALVRPRLVMREPPVPDPDLTPPEALDLAEDLQAPFLIMFTSGLTGKPKAMLHCADHVLRSAAAFAELTGMGPETRLYHVLPMAYMAGFLNAFMAPLMGGATIVEGPLFSPAAAMDFWTRPLAEDVNTLGITPTIAAALTRLTRSAETRAEVGRRMVQVQSTSASVPSAVRRRFREAFGLELQDCYGMTELGGPLTLQDVEDAAAGNERTRPVPQIDMELRGEEGQLWIRSPFRMLGYLDGGDLVRPFDEQGWLDTGDLAVLEDGKLGITGRRKDLIIRGGVNVSPTRVESVLGHLPGLEEVAVLGAPHEFWGEEIVACLVASGEQPDLLERARVHAAEHLGAHERPDRVVLVDELPRTFIGKVQKNVLRERVTGGKARKA